MRKLNRRIFLRGLGGAVVAAPYLSSLYERSAKASTVAAPQRTIVMFTHYGHITNRWFPAKLDGELTAADLLDTSLAPLAPFASKLLVPRGIRSMNEWMFENKGAGKGRGQGVDLHTQVVGSALTCQPVTPNFDDPFNFSADKFMAKPLGPSLDHVLAQQLSRQGVPLLLNAASQNKENPQSAISYSAAERIFDATSLSQAFADLTGLFDPSGPNEDTWEIAKGKQLADIVKEDLATLRRQDLSKADRDKLDGWLELLHTVSNYVGAQCNSNTAQRLGADAPLAAGTEEDALTRKVSDSMDNADLYSAVATLTAACNANPVVVIKYPGNFMFRGLGINADSDNLSKRMNNAGMNGPCAPNAIESLLTIDAYYAQKFANLVNMLDGIQEGERSLLDNSVTVWMTEYSDGAAHNLNNMPIIQAGSGGGYFKTGRIVNLDTGSGATAQDMLGHSLDQCFEGNTDMIDGVNQVTGTDPRFGNRPVNKYFCNIMNAMGLRASAAGYPDKNGPDSEVTHFGYSDKTEDFCGGAGAVAGAGIHDPGAFDELRA